MPPRKIPTARPRAWSKGRNPRARARAAEAMLVIMRDKLNRELLVVQMLYSNVWLDRGTANAQAALKACRDEAERLYPRSTAEQEIDAMPF